MQVFNPEFIAAVKAQLDTLKEGKGFYMTREQICNAIGVSNQYVNALSMITAEPEFAAFESVKSRGYRRKPTTPPSDNG